MLFNSLEYLVLLSVTVGFYWSTQSLRLRQLILFASSVIFYLSWIPIFILLLLTCIGVSYLAARKHPVRRAMAWAVVVNLGALAVFKYSNFAFEIAIDVLALGGILVDWTSFTLILPLGISFFVFQLTAYLIDVKRGRLEPERDLLVFSVFVSFFPQLIAGPICRGKELLPQLKTRHAFRFEVFTHGFFMLMSGLFLKVALADNISPFVDTVFAAPAEATAGQAILGTLGFAAVIFCDFWGYSTMALGAAFMFGIDLPANFSLPYISTSLREFWRRWHITLSHWLRDYLYIELGGSRRGRLFTYRNLAVTMLLGGLWHGAAYTFVVWGAIHGGWLAMERSVADTTGRLRTLWGRWVHGTIGWTITMLVVLGGWIFFRAESLQGAVTLTKTIASFDDLSASGAETAVLFLWLALFIHVPLHAANTYALERWLGERFAGWIAPLKWVVGAWLGVSALVLGSQEVNEFIYFQF